MDSSEYDQVDESILKALHQIVPTPAMNVVLEDLVTGRIGEYAFAQFVCHTLAKSAAEQIFDRSWGRLEADWRRRTARMAVIYVMHCVYEQAAAGRLKLPLKRTAQPERLFHKAG